MTAVAESQGAAARPVHQGKVTQGRVLNSEWIKFRTLRSTLWSLVVAIGLMLFICVMFSAVISNKWPTMSAERRANFDPITVPLRGYSIGQLAVGVLGVMVITGEYSTGMIRASLSAVPKRLPVLWAKAAVFAVVVLVLMTVTSLACFYVGQAFFSSQHIQASLSAPGAARIVFGTGLYLTFVGLLGVALGTIIRSTAGAITALVGILMVLPILGDVLNQTSYGPDVTPYLPSNAGTALLILHPDPNGGMMPWTGFALFAGYVVAATALAAYLLKRRDA
jgi:ABC-type transport system involved in multi-copper enzyme maturation permease subunit